MLTQASEMVMVGLAQRPGTESPCADGADFQRRGSRVCAVVVDGAGHGAEVVRYAATVPAVITQMGMVEGGLAGLVTGGLMAYAYDVPPHASAVYASVEPGRPSAVHWIGDARAYSYGNGELTLWSTDMTMGNYLRGRRGYAPELVEEYDDYARLGLAQAGWATCRLVEIPEEIPLLLLVSDGVSDHVDQGTWKRLCHLHEADPQALADALVAAAEKDADGYRDDCTVIAMRRRTP
ncbi:SpoIIE family protein phosphatase [Streptomyces sp. NPDC006692]|uniref:SpoIIE family protein phosphatase n=1 Tax=unclassified Streptomyces TaxID=2593676 RepID=UPI00343D9E38